MVLYTGAGPALLGSVPEEAGFEVEPWLLDVGVVQQDSLHEAPERTAERAAALATQTQVEKLAEKLASEPDLAGVIVDVAPVGLEAARRIGVPALAMGNFDWAWIYRHYPALQDLAARFAEWQAPHPAIALEPGPGMFGFVTVRPGGLLGRRAPPRRLVGPEERGILVCFGGFGLMDLDARLPRLPGVRYVLAPPLTPLVREDVIWAENEVFPSLVAGADLVYTKPGYGIVVEAALAGTPIVFEERRHFPEAPSLVAFLEARGDGAVGEDRGLSFSRRLREPRPAPMGHSDTHMLITEIEALLG